MKELKQSKLYNLKGVEKTLNIINFSLFPLQVIKALFIS